MEKTCAAIDGKELMSIRVTFDHLNVVLLILTLYRPSKPFIEESPGQPIATNCVVKTAIASVLYSSQRVAFKSTLVLYNPDISIQYLFCPCSHPLTTHC